MTNEEYDELKRLLEKSVIAFGVGTTLGFVAQACDEKQKYYEPNYSVFAAWATAIVNHLSLIRQAASVIYDNNWSENDPTQSCNR